MPASFTHYCLMPAPAAFHVKLSLLNPFHFPHFDKVIWVHDEYSTLGCTLKNNPFPHSPPHEQPPPQSLAGLGRLPWGSLSVLRPFVGRDVLASWWPLGMLLCERTWAGDSQASVHGKMLWCWSWAWRLVPAGQVLCH